jgi:hypothetical protein
VVCANIDAICNSIKEIREGRFPLSAIPNAKVKKEGLIS